MSHSHTLTIPNPPPPQTLIDLMADTVGLLPGQHHTTIQDLTWPHHHTTLVHQTITLTVEHPNDTLRARARKFITFTIVDGRHVPNEPEQPQLSAYGPDLFALAALHNVARVVGGTLTLNDQLPDTTTIRTYTADRSLTVAPLIQRAHLIDAADHAQRHYRTAIRIPALARSTVPALKAYADDR